LELSLSKLEGKTSCEAGLDIGTQRPLPYQVPPAA
jgi:hypothetical protein